MRQALLPLLFLSYAAFSPLQASDGVLEINHTCATETGCFPGDSPLYPVTITKPGTNYILTSKLVVANAVTTAIEVQANDVAIDLNNFTIILSFCDDGGTPDCMPLAGTGSGVASDPNTSSGISVRNGSIIGMGSHGVELGNQSEVTNLRVRWNRLDGINVRSSSIISGNNALQNGRNGIHCDAGCLVRTNVMVNNAGHGLDLHDGSAYSDNVINGNDTGTVTGTGAANTRGGNYCTGTGTTSLFCP